MAANTRTVHVLISGRVQGVGYRMWTENTAMALGLSGWVRNRRDGSVEAVFQGSPEDVAEIIERCWEGPSMAKVARVDVVDESAGEFTDFDVRESG